MKDKYRENLPLEKARGLWSKTLSDKGMLMKPLGPETVRVREALGRVTAGPFFARLSSPAFHSSAMDGYAVKSITTYGATETQPRRLKIGLEAIQIDTGKPMPHGFDAVIMHEDISVEGDSIEFRAPLTPWKNVRLAGEDIVATELIVPENHRLRPMDLAALLASGITEISVRRKPLVSIIPTGSDLVEAPRELKTGEIIEFNSTLLGGLVAEWGGEALFTGIVPDEPKALSQAILMASGKSDIVVVNAGASLGSKDYTFQCMEELGTVVLHGVSMRPGKPVILGIVKGKPVIGAPGFPVSAYTAFVLFGRELLYALQGVPPEPSVIVTGTLSRTLPSTLGLDEFIRVKVGKVGGKNIVTPLSRGAGQLMSLVRADGILQVPAMSEGLGPGSQVEVELLKSTRDIENTVVFIGSHDNAIDLLASFLKRKYPLFSLSSAHVGSMGGLLALKRGEAHCAPTHLLDEETGEYNFSYIKKILPDRKITLINMVYREQGLIVLKGNPKNITSFRDLAREGVRFINRQGGSGTRLLMDKHLKELHIDPSSISGYQKEEYTHMAVASAVLTDAADCGLGVLSAAKALGLDFIPVARERYDIAVPTEFLALPAVEAVLDIIRTDNEFKAMLSQMGGYGLEDMGKVLLET